MVPGVCAAEPEFDPLGCDYIRIGSIMSNEIQLRYEDTGLTIYATVRRPADGYMWNGSAFEAFATANWATYDIACSESPAGGYLYLANFPAVAAGQYYIDFYEQSGAAPAINDTLLASGVLYWDGSAEVSTIDLARTGADSDTLETLSDQLDGVTTTKNLTVSGKEISIE